MEFLQLNKKAPQPLYQQLYESIRTHIVSGKTTDGEKLPSIRQMGTLLSLSRTTVEAAYLQLCVEGYVINAPGRGYFVVEGKQKGTLLPPKPVPVCKEEEQYYRYHLDTKSIDESSFDSALWQRVLRDAMRAREALTSYGDPQGEPALREALSRYATRIRGVIAPPHRLIIGAGVQSLLYLLCGLLEKDTIIGMQAPFFSQAEQVFEDFGMHVVPFELDDLPDAGALYLTPSHHPKTGGHLSASQRSALLHWASQNQRLLIEDDYNGELRFGARPIPAMQGMEGSEHVIYLGSFSKMLLPALRLSYMVLPPSLAASYLTKVSHYHQTCSKIEQLALARYIAQGELEKHLRRLRKLYAKKSTLLLSLLQEHFGTMASFILQETALRLLMTLTHGKAAPLLEKAAAQSVRIMPGPAPNQMVLGFAGIAQEDIAPAVDCLRLAWKDYSGK